MLLRSKKKDPLLLHCSKKRSDYKQTDLTGHLTAVLAGDIVAYFFAIVATEISSESSPETSRQTS
jgi:hypothetical protein